MNLKSVPWTRRAERASFLRISVLTVNSALEASGWKNAVRNPLGFFLDKAIEKIPSCHWNCTPSISKSPNRKMNYYLKFYWNLSELAFKWIEWEVVVIKSPNSTITCRINQEHSIHPIRDVCKCICTISIVESVYCNCCQTFPICHNTFRNLESADEWICF